jgi:sugar lactone lactonase YvrE
MIHHGPNRQSYFCLATLSTSGPKCNNLPSMHPANRLEIISVTPALGIPGGIVYVECRGFEPGLPSISQVLLGEVAAEIVSASADRIAVRLPENQSSLGISLRVRGESSEVHPFPLATRLAADVNPVTSPVIAPDGTIITTISGTRGEQTPQPLIRITPRGEKIPFPCDITNPTGLAFSPDGQLYISSRHDGTVLRYTDYEDLEIVAEDLGVACGIAFDSEGTLFVGDRSGRVYAVNVETGVKRDFAQLEPSVSAYHLVFDAADRLYVTGPTFSMRDSLVRIDPNGDIKIVLTGLGRPQGMAFLPDGDLLVTAAFGGSKGVFRYSPETGELGYYIAAPILVGVAVSENGLVLADTSSIYSLDPGGHASRVS